MQEFWLLIKYLFLGLFQGITEPIPISSSGHLVILQSLMNLELEGLEFLVLVNFGSLIAVLVIYYDDIIRLLKNSVGYLISKDDRQKDDFEFVLYLLIGTVPAGVLGLLFKDFFEQLEYVETVAVALIITGIALWIIRNIRGSKGEGMLTWKDAVIVGLAQAVALIPGISRSGATIVAAMLLGMKQQTALRFSFLLYIPVSLGTMLLSVDELLADDLSTLWLPYLFAFIASVFASYFSLKWFMNIMERGNLKYFAFYCFIVGGLVLFFL
ncbi:undecaprenyl-diphosphate phosphatase [Halobacillus amylolyticus]|uniref:Undecaprenyl-diphosphatase n=1 Tax=Halobacillus amylolyticus TaxID=2932259 RepID=A0ABY4HES7_9BACI|nr:undecaprenyl-diphosphate phosphatase [Halobacillus amylolyticus]UOR13142.1 undecaprenyl-diphosphate phosphatase [Halobacillus amylolyticus]